METDKMCEKFDCENDMEIVKICQKKMVQRGMTMREALVDTMTEYGRSLNDLAPLGEFKAKWDRTPHRQIFSVGPFPEMKTPRVIESVTLAEILDRSLGEIVETLHVSYTVDFGWLSLQYILADQNPYPKMTVFYYKEIRECPDPLPEYIEAHRLKRAEWFLPEGCGFAIIRYKESGVRIVCPHLGLCRSDWESEHNWIWVSQHLPLMDDSAKVTDGESPSDLKREYVSILGKFDSRMDRWKRIFSRVDASLRAQNRGVRYSHGTTEMQRYSEPFPCVAPDQTVLKRVFVDFPSEDEIAEMEKNGSYQIPSAEDREELMRAWAAIMMEGDVEMTARQISAVSLGAEDSEENTGSGAARSSS